MWEKLLYFLGAMSIWTGIELYLMAGSIYMDVIAFIIIGIAMIYGGRRIGKSKKDQEKYL